MKLSKMTVKNVVLSVAFGFTTILYASLPPNILIHNVFPSEMRRIIILFVLHNKDLSKALESYASLVRTSKAFNKFLKDNGCFKNQLSKRLKILLPYMKNNDGVLRLSTLIEFPLLEALKNNDLDAFRLMFNMNNVAPREINKQDSSGFGVLHVAAYMNQVGVVRKLLKRKNEFDINQMDQYGRTALYFAVYHKHMEIIRELVKHKERLKINTYSVYNNSPLSMARVRGDIEIVRLLKGGCA